MILKGLEYPLRIDAERLPPGIMSVHRLPTDENTRKQNDGKHQHHVVHFSYVVNDLLRRWRSV